MRVTRGVTVDARPAVRVHPRTLRFSLNELDRIAIGIGDPGGAQFPVEKIMCGRKHSCAVVR